MQSDNAQTHATLPLPLSLNSSGNASPTTTSSEQGPPSSSTEEDSPKWKHLVNKGDRSTNAEAASSPIMVPRRKPSIENPYVVVEEESETSTQRQRRRRLSLEIDRVLAEIENVCLDDPVNNNFNDSSSSISSLCLPDVPKRKGSLVLLQKE